MKPSAILFGRDVRRRTAPTRPAARRWHPWRHCVRVWTPAPPSSTPRSWRFPKARASMAIFAAVDRRGEEGTGHSLQGVRPGLVQSQGESFMHVMVMVEAPQVSEAGAMPEGELLAAMGHYNEALVKAGVMLAREGLHPSRKGVRGRCARWTRTSSGCGAARTGTRRTARSGSAPSSRPTTSVKPLRPSCASRRIACALRSKPGASSHATEGT